MRLAIPELDYGLEALQQGTLTPELPHETEIGLALRAALLLAACGVGREKSDETEAQSAGPNGLKELENRGATITLGMNTHMSANPAEIENLDLEAFKADVDKLSREGLGVIRFNVWEWEYPDYLDAYKDALTYAKERGLKTYLVTNTPHLSADFSDIEGDRQKTIDYYTNLATEFQGLVDVWQIFNEGDDHTHTRYSRIENDKVYPPGYLTHFAEMVKAANRTIKQIDSQAKTTINVSIWNNPEGDMWVKPDGSVEPRFEEVALFDAVCGFPIAGSVPEDAVCENIDLVSLDLYFDTDYGAIRNIPNLVKYFQERYRIPVVLAEVGLPIGGDGRFNVEDQRDSLIAIIESLRDSDVKLGNTELILYEMRDEYMKAPSDPEGYFGFHDYEGEPKSSWQEILNEWRGK